MSKCSFCGKNIEKGTGKMLVKKDAKVLYFCSNKCEKNLLKLRRKPIKIRWTKAYQELKEKGKKAAEGKDKETKTEKESKETEVSNQDISESQGSGEKKK